MKLVAFDVETRGSEEGYGLQPFRATTGDAWLTMCAMAGEKGVTGYIKPTVDQLRVWLNRCAETQTTITAWNAPFDMAWLIAMGLGDEVRANKWLDAMILWKHLTNAPEWSGLGPKSYGLKAAVAEFMPEHAGYEESIDFDTDDPVELQKLFEYNKKDASFTYQLCEKFLSEMTDRQRRSALIEAVCLPMVAETFVRGVDIDTDAATSLRDKLTQDADVAIVTLKLKTRDEEVTEDVLASPKKLRHLLYDTWGLTAPKHTPKGEDSTDRDALSQLAEIDDRASLLNAYREAKNNRTKFAEGSLKSAEYNGDSKSRPMARVFGTYTGRMTYSSKIGRGKAEKPTGIALHQWKRDTLFRDIITVPDGYTLMEFDFAGQEFRWMAVMSKDDQMLNLCAPGEDAHGYMGGRIGKVPYRDMIRLVSEGDREAKALRQLGKVGNLSCQYRTSANTLRTVARVQYGLTLSEAEAKAIHANYRMSYPWVPKYWKDQSKHAEVNGYVETITGRRVRVGVKDQWLTRVMSKDIPDTWIDQDNTWRATSTAINFPIQGSGADQKYLAMAVMKNKLTEYGGHFYFELHDGLFYLIPDAKADKAVHEIKHFLSNLPYKKAWGVDLPIQFPVDAKVGKSWGQLKEVHDG